MASKRTATASAAVIRRILGFAEDDEVVMAIHNTGASAAEVLQALEWLNSGGGAGPVALHGNAGRVFSILMQERNATRDGPAQEELQY